MDQIRGSGGIKGTGEFRHFFHMMILFYRVESHKFISFDRLSKFHVVFEILWFSCVNFRRFRGQKWPFLDGFRAIKWKVLHENTWNLVETCIWCCWEWKISFSLLLEEKCQKIAIFRFFDPFSLKRLYLKIMSEFFPEKLEEIESWNLVWMIPAICS